MELTNTVTATIKTPEAETEAPTRIQPNKPLSFSNGVLKRHHPLRPHHQLSNPPVVVTFKECLKNHAASLGGHAVDGCGEFMSSPNANPTDPTSLKCAACGCHRNFHRREPEEPYPQPHTTTAQHVIEYQPHHRHHPPPPPLPPPRGGDHSSSPNSPSPPPISSSYYPSAPHMLLALSTGVSGPQSENNPPISATPGITAGTIGHPNGRKRFRTKFTQDQKERMFEFAEKVDWKILKRDEEQIKEFCSEIGVDKGVLKVWMHNNKSTLGKRDANNNGIGSSNTIDTTHHHHDNNNVDNGSVNVDVVVTNGSSSSS